MNLPFVKIRETILCFEIATPSISPVLHTHDSYEFFFCLSGGGEQRTEKKSYPMKKGAFFMYGPFIPHACCPNEKTGCMGLVINLHPEFFSSMLAGDKESRLILEGLFKYSVDTNNRLPLADSTVQAIGRVFKNMVSESRRKIAGFECALKIGMQEILLLLLRDAEMSGVLDKIFAPVRSDDRIKDVLEYLTTHYVDPITIEQAANLACMSRSHFHAVFKKTTGKTLVHYLNEVRTEAAARLLSEKDTPVSRVGLDCGFPCASHFYYVFKSITGKTPREFRGWAGLK
jgi:AraC-like DNA-binding protein